MADSHKYRMSEKGERKRQKKINLKKILKLYIAIYVEEK